MKSKTKKSRTKTKPRTIDQARVVAERAEASVKAAKEEVRATKSRLKAAKKSLKSVEKAAKKARKEARRASKALEVMVARQRARKKKAGARPNRSRQALEAAAPEVNRSEATTPAPVAADPATP